MPTDPGLDRETYHIAQDNKEVNLDAIQNCIPKSKSVCNSLLILANTYSLSIYSTFVLSFSKICLIAVNFRRGLDWCTVSAGLIYFTLPPPGSPSPPGSLPPRPFSFFLGYRVFESPTNIRLSLTISREGHFRLALFSPGAQNDRVPLAGAPGAHDLIRHRVHRVFVI